MLLNFADWLAYGALGLATGSRLGGAVSFFVYDAVKITALLFGLILVIGVVRTYLPQRRIRDWMGKRGGAGNFFAALFGALTPFCSCSSIPLFIGFMEAGVPLGVNFSFLIASPLINEYLVVLMLGFFGWKITAAYVAAGLFIGTAAGIVLGRMNLERHLAHDLVTAANSGEDPEYGSFKERLAFGWRESASITGKIWGWVLVGVAVGAFIHNFVPEAAIHAAMDKTGVFSVPLATILGVPMYGSCAGIVPIAVVLFQKGVPLGTALAFMMAIAALSLPEAIMLRRAMKLQLIAVFFGVTTAGIIVIGYALNFLQGVAL